MRRPRPAQVILPMLALPLLLVALAMLLLPDAASAEGRAAGSRGHASYFSLVPRSLLP